MADQHRMKMVQGRIRAVYTTQDGEDYIYVNGERVYLDPGDSE